MDMTRTAAAMLAFVLAAGVAGCEDADRDALAASRLSSTQPATAKSGETVTEVIAPVTTPPAAPRRTTLPKPAQPSQPARSAAAPLLYAAAGGDGDSWKDRSGREYRLGLVNAPETGACFAAEATAKRRSLVRGGFLARTYVTDRYGRGVSLISLPDGRNLNLLLAQQGFVDDRYLAEFRHENEALARQLDSAFASAKAAKRGLWGACIDNKPQGFAAPPPAKPANGCHPDYATCIPVKGDGSGRGAANDLDCPDIGKLVQLRRIGVDPYRLDANSDGTGCESYG